MLTLMSWHAQPHSVCLLSHYVIYMNNNKSTGVNLNSKDAVYFALIQQLPQLLGLVLVASVGLPILFWMFGNLNRGVALRNERSAAVSECKMISLRKYGNYDATYCYEWSKQKVPWRWQRRYSASADTKAVEHLSNRWWWKTQKKLKNSPLKSKNC